MKFKKKYRLVFIYILAIIWIIVSCIAYIKSERGIYLLQIGFAVAMAIVQSIYVIKDVY